MLTVLFPQSAQALAFRRRHAAACDPYSFATAASSVGSWVSDAWLLEGDGRSIATRTQRLMAFLAVLDSCDNAALPPTLGMAKVLLRLADDALGSDEFEKALHGERALAARHLPLIEAMRLYEEALKRAGLVDAGRACFLMAQHAFPGRESNAIVVYDDALSAAQRKFADACSAHIEYRVSFDGVIKRPSSEIELRFAFPSGRYAEAFLLADAVQHYVSRGSVLMTARDPLALYLSLADAFDERGISVAVRARRPFRETDFGRAFFAALRIVEARDADKQSCADFLLNPFSGLSAASAYDTDALLRRDRLLSREDCLDAMRHASRSFEYFEDLVSSPDSDSLLGYFEDRTYALGRDAAYAAEQASAISVVRDAMTAARRMGAGPQAVASVLDAASVDVSQANTTSSADVLIVDARQIDSADGRTWNTVIMCDMDNVSFPVKNSDDAAYALASDLGVARPRRALDELRKAFVSAVAKAKDALVIERRLNDESADPTYPAATVEEFVDCFRDDVTDASEIDNRYSLPECLMGGLLERGEEALYENCSLRGQAQQRAARVKTPTLSRIESQEARNAIVLPRVGKGGVVVAGPCFSASQIESYLECPQKWFALRRLRLDDIEEGFGAVEMGDFSHGVLESFYCRFQQETAPKVSVETLGEARRIMGEVLAEHRAEQFERKPASNRLVPVSVYEHREVDDLSDRLMGYLDREAALLPDFAPYELEYEIPVHQALDYAGCKLVGKIDRIDVDRRGRAIVIDYKSSVSPDYDLYEPDSKGGAMKEGKVQALIYAQAVRRFLGLDVVGALYVGYGRVPRISGALSRDIEPAHVAGLRAGTCVYRGDFGERFCELLDATERRIAVSLQKLLDGDIAPAPSTPRACSYCPEISCPQRRG